MNKTQHASMKNYVSEMDAIYAATLNEPATTGQCDTVAKTMKAIADRCLKTLEDRAGTIGGELQMRLIKVRRMALDEIDMAQKECDILSHWPLMRDMLTVMPRPTR